MCIVNICHNFLNLFLKHIMLNEVIVRFASGLRYSFVVLLVRPWFSFPLLRELSLHGLCLSSWNGKPKWQKQFFLFSKENWPLIGRDERKEELKRLNPKGNWRARL